MKKYFPYFVIVLIFAFFGVPFVMWVAEELIAELPRHWVKSYNIRYAFMGGFSIIGLSAIWWMVSKFKSLPEKAFFRYLPLAIAFSWYMIAFIISFQMLHYSIVDGRLERLMSLVVCSYTPFNPTNLLWGEILLYPIAQSLAYGYSAIVLLISCIIDKRKTIIDIKSFLLLFVAIILCGISVYQLDQRNQHILPEDYRADAVYDSFDYLFYRPFEKNNRLYVPDEEPSLSIDKDYPLLDGATAVYPVYSAAAQAVYKGLDYSNASDYIDCNKTNEAYERLIFGDIDIFFGAQPSVGHIQLAKQEGVELYLTPIAKEAFVFFNNRANPVTNLTVSQIQDIYQKKITSWSTVGGERERILPFQRPENSGSQTIMLTVMDGKPLPTPLIEEYEEGMGDIISEVAAYRNYAGAIGYSFRYFATGLNPNENIRLLSIGGIEPTVENIQNGTYPFIIDIYAVTTKEPEGNVKALIDWFTSPEGQELVEGSGYVGIQ